MKHIAVIIRGHLRTWNYTKQISFDFYDSIADKVDYYFATWQMYDPVVIHNVIQDFEGRNLVKLLTMPITNENYNGWVGPGLSNYLLIPYKKQREKQIKYDAVFDTRPDILPYMKSGPVIPPESRSLYTTYFNNQREMLYDPNSEFHIGLGDHFFMMTSEVHDIISQRYILEAAYGPHVELQQICESEGINACNLSWAGAEITRPNCMDEVPDPSKYYTAWRRDWGSISSEEKMECLIRHSIKIEDYITGSKTSTI